MTSLEALAKMDLRRAAVVELRFLRSSVERRDVLRVSPQPVVRDWRLARAQFARELRREQPLERLSAPFALHLVSTSSRGAIIRSAAHLRSVLPRRVAIRGATITRCHPQFTSTKACVSCRMNT